MVKRKYVHKLIAIPTRCVLPLTREQCLAPRASIGKLTAFRNTQFITVYARIIFPATACCFFATLLFVEKMAWQILSFARFVIPNAAIDIDAF